MCRRRLPRMRRAASTRETRSPVNSATFFFARKWTVAKQPLPSISDFLTSMPCASSLMLTFVLCPCLDARDALAGQLRDLPLRPEVDGRETALAVNLRLPDLDAVRK